MTDTIEGNTVCPESTIESANRRNFIKKAAIVTAAAGIGGVFLDKNVLPESSASSADVSVTTPGCNTSGRLAVWNAGSEITDVGPASLITSSCCTILHVQNTGKGYGIRGCAVCGVGVCGHSTAKAGVYGFSKSKYGVHGCSSCSYGVFGGGACAGVAGCSKSGIGVCGYSCSFIGVKGRSNTGIGIQGTGVFCGVNGVSGSGNGVQGCSDHGAGVQGNSLCDGGTGVGVAGHSYYGAGVQGNSEFRTGVYGNGPIVGVEGQSCSPGGISLRGLAGCPCVIPIVAKGASSQKANLMQFENTCSTPLSVFNQFGYLGIGTCNPKTALDVRGSISANLVSPTNVTTYCLGASCFAVLTNSATTVNLPKASTTAAGMIVLIKRTGTKTVAVKPFQGDKIESKTSVSLSKQYDSLLLISNGSNEWFLVGNSVGDKFVS
jgi:hypothetical protein